MVPIRNLKTSRNPCEIKFGGKENKIVIGVLLTEITGEVAKIVDGSLRAAPKKGFGAD